MGANKLKIFTTVREMQMELTKLKKYGKTVGFVPTMGFLHEGHLELIKRARQENDLVVMSIFVNPLQFGPTEDLATYPRDLERDQRIAKEERVDYLFCPSVEEMIAHNISVQVTVQKRTDVLCGKSRPGHFNGVATILTMLFHVIMPNRVYFGLKDAQQVAVIEGLIKDFHFPIQLVPVETVREIDGLAKSSRNVYLQQKERQEATHLYQCLLRAKEKIIAGEQSILKVKQLISDYLTKNTSGEIDYVEILSFPELTDLDNMKGTIIIAIAVKFSQARLIDNIIFTVS